MKYILETWSITKLLDLYEDDKLNLNPPYQRNDIWSLSAKKRLIDTIKKKFPLPNFFLYLNPNGKYEMVDGQQRTRTFLGYKAMLFPDTNKNYIKDSDENYFLNDYQLIVVIISDVSDKKLIVEFYHDVNKFGTKLNRPEILRSEHFDSPVQNLIEEISNSSEFKELSLFSKTSETRLMDQDFIGELLSIIKFGITDKKKSADSLFAELEGDEEELDKLKNRFWEVINLIRILNNIYPISNTRYKQKNDFHTLFSFINQHSDLDEKLLQSFYNVLVKIDPKISPSNEDCFAFQNYAFNCITQSNSKKSREQRIKFFDNILMNQRNDYKLEEGNLTNDFEEVMIYYGLGNSDLVKEGDYYILPFDKL